VCIPEYVHVLTKNKKRSKQEKFYTLLGQKRGKQEEFHTLFGRTSNTDIVNIN